MMVIFPTMLSLKHTALLETEIPREELQHHARKANLMDIYL